MSPKHVHAPMTVPIGRLRANLRAVLRRVEEDSERIVLTRRGRPVAALVPVGAVAALDLLGRMLPAVADAAAGLRDPSEAAAGLPDPGPDEAPQ